jgi:hypothetical protein
MTTRRSQKRAVGRGVVEVDDRHALEKAVPGLVFGSEWWFGTGCEIEQHYPWVARQLLRIMYATPLRRLSRGLRYHFGRDT